MTTLILAACYGSPDGWKTDTGADSFDTAQPTTTDPTTTEETGAEDTGALETGSSTTDTSVNDTGLSDTGLSDTGRSDTGSPVDTGPDTGGFTGSTDSGAPN